MRDILIILILIVLALGVPVGTTAQAQAIDSGPAPASPLAFWESLGDATLEGLIAQALDANPTLHAAEARVRSARAVRLDAMLDLTPSVTANAGYNVQRLSSATIPGPGGAFSQDLWDAGVEVGWELDVFGQARRTLEGRGDLVASAREDVQYARVLLAVNVAQAYFDLRSAQARLEVARRNAENQRRTLEVTQERLNSGHGTALDTERAQTQLSSTRAAVPALEAAIAAAQHRIGALLGGRPGAVVPELEDAAPLPVLPPVADVPEPEGLVHRRADVRSMEQQLAAHTAFVAAARAAYLPRLSIRGTMGYTAGALDGLGGSGTPHYAIGPVVTFPLFDLGRVKAGVEATRAEQAQAEARYEDAILRAEEEAATSIVAYRKARERLEHLEAAAAASERASELARLRFEEGETNYLDVLDAERTQLEVQDRLATGRAAALAELLALYHALGGTWPTAGTP